MKYCPECEAEYVDEVQSCADCELPLISEEEYQGRRQRQEQEREALSREEFVPVKVADNAFEADRIREPWNRRGSPSWCGRSRTRPMTGSTCHRRAGGMWRSRNRRRPGPKKS
jgi:hypothetical protein